MQRDEPYDLLVIGGGINGCGIARDAVGRGYSVLLVEKDDLASGTSSASTKLIHGGLRYLEFYEFRLVREALAEREVLWRNAPHIIRPMRFVLPLAEGIRPDWLVRLGLFLYDHIGGRKLLPATKTLDMRVDPAGKPLKPIFRRAFEYSDGWVDDARLVVLNARDAADRGATVLTRTAAVSARRENGLWMVSLEDRRSRVVTEASARMLVNAGGPWVDHVLSAALGQPTHNVRLVKGSHIVVRKKFDDPRAYFFQNRDGRIIFAIPYEGAFTLIGTTDLDYAGEPGAVAISEAEIGYLCDAASEYFAEPVRRSDVVWTYSGVRALLDDGASKAHEATRDYVLKVEGGEGGPAVLNVFGGKITTYRRLAESALERIEAALGRKGSPWTAAAPLPGGEFPVTGFDAEAERLRRDYPFLDSSTAVRLMRLYGTRARRFLGAADARPDLGRPIAGLFEAELRYLIAEEWAQTADDVLWRRTKQGLHAGPDEVAGLDDFMRGAVDRRDAA